MRKRSPPDKPPKPIQISKQLARLLAERTRLFSSGEAKKIAEEGNLKIKNIKSVLMSLKTQGWIHPLRRDLYTLDSVLCGGQPIHEFEIATRLVKPSAISHFTALHYHELTDQIPQIVFALTPTGASLPRPSKGSEFAYKGVRYHYTQVKSEYFFGIENIWIGDTSIPITDIERTLLDGMMKPKYCGGFMEVLSAFSTNQKFSLAKIIEYALRLDVSTAKRLGWVLEHIGTKQKILKPLDDLPFSGFIKLDASAKKSGPYNKRWKIQENI